MNKTKIEIQLANITCAYLINTNVEKREFKKIFTICIHES